MQAFDIVRKNKSFQAAVDDDGTVTTRFVMSSPFQELKQSVRV